MSKKPKPPISIYSALADDTRCRILDILRGGPQPVHILADHFSISRPAISRHLRVLKTAGLVAEVKKGRENLYAFKPARLQAARAFIDSLVGGNAAALPARRPVTRPITPALNGDLPPRKPTPVASVSQMGFDF